jgi:acylphosphatase
MKRNHVVIEGRVQGVFFRTNTQRMAASLGLTGWVRNLSDGRVEAVFEGEESNLAVMLEWCWKGPPYAAVRRVDVTDEPYTGDYTVFSVRY